MPVDISASVSAPDHWQAGPGAPAFTDPVTPGRP